MKALCWYRVAAKWFSFFIFGAGTLILVTAFFPFMRLLLHPRRRFQKSARLLVSLSFRFFVGIMTALRIVELRPGDRLAYRKLGGKIAAANHPSLLDVVMLISLIPNADCIVRGSLTRTIMRGIIRQLYIPNSGNAETLIADCVASIKEGNCIIIFPEGTRTPRGGKQAFKKGAVRIALAAGCPIVPVRIGGTDKFGLGKKDPWTGFSPAEKYVYRLEILDELESEAWAGMNTALAARRWNKALYRALFPAGDTII
ncbi:MAG: 1-acyl-sn-glycerol-3-phosphate acyltransferase [Treponema sp.]|jgi:1-acyl-sn-glycerol-3-phosphate acyltransferase|nr:1-acyl-sn-glycerol-3-phosphate acyltransferase [Treponema sp.]